MSRYCSIAKYKDYVNSLKNFKEINFKGIRITKELEMLMKHGKSFKDSVGRFERFKNNISETGIKLQENSKCLSAVQKFFEEKKSTILNHVTLKKEAQKLCSDLQKRITNEKAFILGTAGLSIIQNKPNDEQTVIPIPEPPPVPDGTEVIVNQINALGEPTFESLGLGGHSPVGLAQYCFEYVHVTLGVEWWAAIVIAQKNAAKMNNYLPQMQAIQLKMTEARQTGNQIDTARYSQELMVFMKEKQLNPLKNMIVPLAQMPVFVSFFMALRQMSNVPVESLRTGGLWWFTDLTLPDQYFLMPIITSATLYATIELGTDSAKLSAQNMQLMKYVLRGLPLLVLPFTVNFPGAILCYWVSSNFISLIQVGILRIPTVRDYFNIEPHQKFNPENLPIKPKGFKEGLKDKQRRRLDEIQFQRAGKGPIVKTYKYDPTKQADPINPAPISAKKL
ncbi:hypothetical protein NQ314_017874 [Rhamnusium bicolor]|uniref:Membrane insertase YidC/Oxa/ALB C-terminal domain-containing protein n=1 Tax=Rhamnusium bicolor TaxID=1586634 RepID=A0AAV8WRN5_9CUCU|nr:hypothetical protein NQ314_017874 [Rhamnusium bicolor]